MMLNAFGETVFCDRDKGTKTPSPIGLPLCRDGVPTQNAAQGAKRDNQRLVQWRFLNSEKENKIPSL
jgi:hypothetical protein